MMYLSTISPKAWLAGTTVLLIIITLQLIHAFGGHTERWPIDTKKWSTAVQHTDSPVTNATLGFQKILVLNMPSRWDRRDSMALAARLTNLDMDFLDGVSEVDKKLLPGKPAEKMLSQASFGSWRSWVNALRHIVEQNITSALILEDDADWDLRLKSQMQTFAKASNFLLDPVNANTTARLEELEVPVPHSSSGSPYGDSSLWDVLWLGHCGTRFPDWERHGIPTGQISIQNDLTVPEIQHVDFAWGGDELKDAYPQHTRIVLRSRETVCTAAIAVSQKGAQRLLEYVGLEEVYDAADLMIQHFCNGARESRSLGHLPFCLTVQPTFFGQHRPKGPNARLSDISDFDEGTTETAHTCNIRWSTRLNFNKLLYGEDDYLDRYQDGKPKGPCE